MWDIYLAGSMTGRKVSEVLFERAEAKALLTAYGLSYYDPADGEGLEFMESDAIISNAFDEPRMRSFVKKDLAAVAACKAVLNLTGDKSSDGSSWEMAFAIYHRQIPVHIIAPERLTGAKMGFTNILVDGIHEHLVDAVIAVDKAIKEAI